MLLNNFRRVLVNTISSIISITALSGMSGEVKTTGGIIYSTTSSNYKDSPDFSGVRNECSICVNSGSYDSTYIPTSSFSLSGCQIYLGTGDVAPTIDDYKLSGDLIVSLTSQSRITSATNNSIIFSAVATNNTDTPVTIKEIGLGCYTSGSPSCVVLLTRDVLPAPVTLNTGDSKLFSVTIDLRSLTDSTINN